MFFGQRQPSQPARSCDMQRDAYFDFMIDWSACSAVERYTDKLSGAWRFKSTRVPVKALFENLESGATVDDFLGWFPGVKREQVLAVLAFAEQSLAAT